MAKKKIVKKKVKKKHTGSSKLTTSVEKDGIISSTESHSDPVLFDSPPCLVGVSLSYTKNLGNYESMKMGVSLQVPCALEEVDHTYKHASSWVDTKLSDLMDEGDDDLDGN